ARSAPARSSMRRRRRRIVPDLPARAARSMLEGSRTTVGLTRTVPSREPMKPRSHSHPFGIVRREFLQVGFSGFLGMGLPGLIAGQARARESASGTGAAERPRARSMILVFLTGGLSHLDSFDLKPDAPGGVRDRK